MSDERPLPQDEGLPAWLRGRIHPYPGEPAQPLPPAGAGAPGDAGQPSEGDAIDLLAIFDAAGEPGAPEIPVSDAGEVLPWDADAGADQALPSAGELKGLTGELPWMSDVVADASPDALAGPPAAESPVQDAALPWLEDETPSSVAEDDVPMADWFDQAPPPPAIPAEEGPGFLEDDATLAGAFDEPSAAPEQGEETPDWLVVADALAGDEAPPDAPAEDAVPDWLSTGDLTPEAAAGIPAEALAPADAPDWLAAVDDFGGDEDEDDEYQPAASAEPVGDPEWLITDTGEGPVDLLPDDSGLTYEEWEQTQDEEEAAPSPEELLAQEVPDWFAAIDEDEEGAAPPLDAAAPAAEGADFVPDWYLGLEEQDTSEAPEWFNGLDFSADALTAEPVLPEAPEPPTPESAPAAPATPTAGEAPDWLQDLGEDMPAAEQAKPPTGELDELFGDMDFSADAGPVEEVPDWFTGIGDDAPAPPPAAPRPPTAPLDDVGDLFGDLDFTPDDAAALAEAAVGDEGEKISPDWLSAIGQETGLVSDLPELDAEPDFDFLADLPSEGADADLDDLFGELDESVDESVDAADFEEAAAPPPPSPEPSVLEPGQAPDWLADIQPEDMPLTTDGLLAGGGDFMAVIEDELGEFDPFAEAGVSPDSQLVAPADGTLDLEALLSEGDLSPTSGVDRPPPAAPGPAPTGDDAEMPGWLLDARPDESRGGFSVVDAAMRQAEEAPVEELTDRLQHLREATRRAAEAAEDAPPAPSDAASQVLAGVTDGLMPTHLFEEPTGPEVMLTVELDEAQEARVATLEALLGLDALHEGEPAYDEDGEPIPVDYEQEALRVREAARRARARSRFKPGRVVISLLLVVAAVIPFLVDLSSFLQLPVAALDTARHGELDAQIERLERGDLVLVGFEYGPTSAGEMDVLAETLLSHILIKGAVPVIVSTNPAGTLHSRDVLGALAGDEWLLAHMGRPANRPLETPDDYVILAYQPGESVGLRYLAECFTGTGALDCSAVVADYQGNPTGLVDVSFALMITLAERGEDVRLWVEQVGAVVPAPLAAAVTVGAEPIARPYFASGQLIGLLAGYRDAYIYDTVLLAALPPVQALPPSVEDTPAGDETPVEAAALPTVTPTEDSLTFLATPTAGEVLPTATLQGLVTRTPTPSLTPSITLTPSLTFTPSATATATRTPTFTHTPRPQDLTQAAIAIGSGTPLTATPTPVPSHTPTIALVTETPAPEGTVVDEAADGTVVADAALAEQVVQPERVYREERWYSLTLSAIAATIVIGLGAMVNIFRGIRRRREQ